MLIWMGVLWWVMVMILVGDSGVVLISMGVSLVMV